MQGHRLPSVKVCSKCGQNTAELEYTSTYGKQYRCQRVSCMHIEVVEEGMEE